MASNGGLDDEAERIMWAAGLGAPSSVWLRSAPYPSPGLASSKVVSRGTTLVLHYAISGGGRLLFPECVHRCKSEKRKQA